MKLVIGMLLLTVTSLALAMDDKEEAAYMNKLIADCKVAEKTTDADILAMRKKTLPTSKEAKCMIGCIFEKMSFIVNGKFVKANADLMADKMITGAPEELKKAKASNDACDKISKSWGADKCVNGPLLAACMKKIEPDFELFPPQ